jgi:hypothetical protein
MINEQLIRSKTSEELLLMHRTPEDWAPEALALALDELQQRGINPECPPALQEVEAKDTSQSVETADLIEDQPKIPISPGSAATCLFVAAPFSIGILSHIFNPTGGGLIAGALAIVGAILVLMRAYGAAKAICVLLLLICGSTFVLSLFQIAQELHRFPEFGFGFLFVFLMRGGAAVLLVYVALRSLRPESAGDAS